MDLLNIAKELAETSHIVQQNAHVLEKSAVTTNNIVRNTLLGSGIGALAGGVGNVYLQRKLDKQKANTLKDAILGAIVGGGVGAGAGIIGNKGLGIDPDTVHNVNLGKGVSIPVTESSYQAASKIYDPQKRYEMSIGKLLPGILGGVAIPPIAAASRKLRGLPITATPFEGSTGAALGKKMIDEGGVPHPSAIANPEISEHLRNTLIAKAESVLAKVDANKGATRNASRVTGTPPTAANTATPPTTPQPVRTNVKPVQGYAKDVIKAYADYMRSAKTTNASPVDKQVALENLQKAINEFNIRNGTSRINIDKVQSQAAAQSAEQLKRYSGVNTPTDQPGIRRLNNIISGARTGGLINTGINAAERMIETRNPLAPAMDLGYSLYDRMFRSPIKELKDK